MASGPSGVTALLVAGFRCCTTTLVPTAYAESSHPAYLYKPGLFTDMQGGLVTTLHPSRALPNHTADISSPASTTSKAPTLHPFVALSAVTAGGSLFVAASMSIQCDINNTNTTIHHTSSDIARHRCSASVAGASHCHGMTRLCPGPGRHWQCCSLHANTGMCECSSLDRAGCCICGFVCGFTGLPAAMQPCIAHMPPVPQSAAAPLVCCFLVSTRHGCTLRFQCGIG